MKRWGKYSISEKKMRQKYPGDILRRRFVETRRLPCQLRLEEGGKVTGRGLEDEEEFLLWLYYTQVLLYCTVYSVLYHCTAGDPRLPPALLPPRQPVLVPRLQWVQWHR